jgi:hypothetical protein
MDATGKKMKGVFGFFFSAVRLFFGLFDSSPSLCLITGFGHFAAALRDASEAS